AREGEDRLSRRRQVSRRLEEGREAGAVGLRPALYGLPAPSRERRQLLRLSSAHEERGELWHTGPEPARLRQGPRLFRSGSKDRVRADLQSAGARGMRQHAEVRGEQGADHRTDQGHRGAADGSREPRQQVAGARGRGDRMSRVDLRSPRAWALQDDSGRAFAAPRWREYGGARSKETE